MNFNLWLEGSGSDRYIFCDLNETLIHEIEVGWLKDCKGNINYLSINKPGKHPHPGVVDVEWEGDRVHIFPRPFLKEWLVAVNKFAKVCILTHSKCEWATKAIGALKFRKYLYAIHSTRDLGPNELAKKYSLGNKDWVLVDNMKEHTVEIVNKLRILGIVHKSCPNLESEGEKIMKEGRLRFIHIKDWYPKIYDVDDDYYLMRIIPEIRDKLGLAI